MKLYREARTSDCHETGVHSKDCYESGARKMFVVEIDSGIPQGPYCFKHQRAALLTDKDGYVHCNGPAYFYRGTCEVAEAVLVRKTPTV